MTPRFPRRWLLAALSFSTLNLPAQPTPEGTAPGNAAPTSPTVAAPVAPQSLRTLALNPDEVVDEPLNLPATPLIMLIEPIERLTGRTILRQQGLPNPEINLVLKKRFTNAETLQAIETALNLNQIALIPLGDKFLKMVPMTTARFETPELITGSTLDLTPSGRIVSKIFHLQFLRASEAMGYVQPMVNVNINFIGQFDKANAILVTDAVSTLQRVEQLLNELDRPAAAGMSTKFYTLTNGSKASDVVNKLRTILTPMQAQLSSSTSYSADDRTNQIILVSDPRQFQLFDDLIAKLDVKADPNTRNEVIYLKHAAAKDVSTLLSSLISNKGKVASTDSVRPNQFARQQPVPPPPGGTENAPAPTPSLSIADLGGVGNNEFSSLVNIEADERSNSVVVSGTVDDIRLIKELVEKIDIILAQVRIEVLIAEVQLDNANQTGVASLGLNVQNGKLLGFTAEGPGYAIGGPAATTGGTNTVPSFATLTGRYDLSGIVSLGTNSTKSNVRILASQTLATTHNKEAKLFVGESRPVFGQVQTVDSTSGGTNGNASALRSSIEQQEAGTSIKIKPLIGSDGTVQLEIEQTFNAFGSTPVSLGSDLQQAPINKREANSFISVRDGDIIVLGGYRNQSTERTRSRLGPIPIIGDLLGARNYRTVNNELVVFIRPHVLLTVDKVMPDSHQIIQENANLRAIQNRLDPALPPPDPERKGASSGPSLKRPK
jgi:general secretion pathway protein D